MRSQSLRNINVSETVYSGAGEDGELFSKPSIDDDILEILKTEINCDEDTRESLSLCSLIMLLIVFCFNFSFSILSLLDTEPQEISRKCPESILWYYLLSSVIVLNSIYYICLKINTLIDSGNLTHAVPSILLLSNSLFSRWGYLCINDDCIVTNFQNTQIWTMSRYNTYAQGIISLSMIIPITSCVHDYCKKNKSEENSEEKSEENSEENSEEKSEENSENEIKLDFKNNIHIEVIENSNESEITHNNT